MTPRPSRPHVRTICAAASCLLLAPLLATPRSPAASPATAPVDRRDNHDGPRDVHDVTDPPAYDTFVIVPLRVHVLTADDLPEADCKLTDADVRRIIGKVNGVWHKAGVHFGLESILHEPAEGREAFRAAAHAAARAGAAGNADGGGRGADPLDAFALLRPQGSRKFEGLHVYYVHELPVNGVYMGRDFAIVKETASLRRVPGGIDEPIPRVTAHELGHALGLPHRQDRTNLMASGTTGTLLNTEEASKAHDRAGRVAGAAAVGKWKDAAEAAAKAGEQDKAKGMREWLAGVPGEAAALEKTKRE